MGFTFPQDEWLIGMEFVPELELTFADGVSYTGAMFSVGFFIFRIDYLINN